jgi:type IV pilus assembly protein PilA
MIDRLRKRITTSEREGGFTLIELLVVLIIIAVLLAIAIPSYLGFKSRAELRTAQSNVRAAIPAVEAYYSDSATGSYAGMTNPTLRAIDQGIPAALVVNVTGGGTGYCLQFTQGGKTAKYAGPGVDASPVEGTC